MVEHHYLEVKGLQVSIDRHQLLSNIGFRLYPGELCALIGPSGAGKSTLIKSLLGVMDYEGHIRRPEQNKPIAYVPQDDYVHTALRVEQELDYACQLRLPHISKARRQAHIRKIAHEVDLVERLSLPIRRLSGGQRKRVSIALELLTRPELMILDEPTSGLDPGMDARMMQLFARIASQQKIVLVATHSMLNLASCQLLLLMQQGYLVFFGSPDDALRWFRVETFEDIFIRLQQHHAQHWASRYQQSELPRQYGKRLPPAIVQQRQQASGAQHHKAKPSSAETTATAQSTNDAAEVLRRLRQGHRS